MSSIRDSKKSIMSDVEQKMVFVPLTQKIEIDIGFKTFYKLGDKKVHIKVLDTGINVMFDTTTDINLAQISKTGCVREYFKPIKGTMMALKYAKTLDHPEEGELISRGLVLTSMLEFS